MKCHPRKWKPSAELKQELHRNALRIALALIIVIGLALFVPSLARCHRFNGVDMLAVVAGVLVKAASYKPVGR